MRTAYSQYSLAGLEWLEARAKADAVAPAGALFPPALAGAISKVDATPRDVARCVADALVDAELRGGLGVADLVIDG